MKAVVVLGKNPEKGEEEIIRRVKRGIEVFYKRKANFFIVSGGTTSINEAEFMEKIAEKSIDRKNIIREEKSKDTVENALFTFKIAKEKKIKEVYVVSSDYHKKRVEFLFKNIFEKRGIKVNYEYIKTGKEESKELFKKTKKKYEKIVMDF